MVSAEEIPDVTRAIPGTVVGRSCGELLWLRTEEGRDLPARVDSILWRRLPLGCEVWVELDERGVAARVGPIEKGES
jgi:hypothetical protein